MDAELSAHELLAQYSQLTGLAGLRFNAQGCARILFGDSTGVDLEIDRAGGCLQIYGVLGPVPAGGREQLYRKLLEGNLFGTQTQGASLAIDSVQEELLLCRRVDPGHTTPADFADLLDTFAGTMDKWLRQLASGELLQQDTHPRPVEAVGICLRA